MVLLHLVAMKKEFSRLRSSTSKSSIMEQDKKRRKWTGKEICKISIYVLVMVLLGIMLAVLCIKATLQYNEWPIYTETNIVQQNEARFPAMTFCPLSSGYKEDVLQVNSGLINYVILKKLFNYDS